MTGQSTNRNPTLAATEQQAPARTDPNRVDPSRVDTNRVDTNRGAIDRESAWREYHEMMGRHKRDFVDRVMGAVAQAKEARVRERGRRAAWREYREMMDHIKHDFVEPVMEAIEGKRPAEPQQEAPAVARRELTDAEREEDRRQAWHEWHAMMRRHRREFVLPIMKQAAVDEAAMLDQKQRMAHWRAYHDMMRRHKRQFVDPVMKPLIRERQALLHDRERHEAWREYHEMMDHIKHDFVDPVMDEIEGKRAPDREGGATAAAADATRHDDAYRRESWRQWHAMMRRHKRDFVDPVMKHATEEDAERTRYAARAAGWKAYHEMMRRHREQFVDPVMKPLIEAKQAIVHERERREAWREYHEMMDHIKHDFVEPVMEAIEGKRPAEPQEAPEGKGEDLVSRGEAQATPSADPEALRIDGWRQWHAMMRRHRRDFVEPVMKQVAEEERARLATGKGRAEPPKLSQQPVEPSTKTIPHTATLPREMISG